MSELLSAAASRGPALRPLCLVLKIFMREQGLHRPYSGGLASVSLNCMAIAYLRQPFVDASGSADLGHLLIGFLDFFGNRFEYATTGVSIHAGFFSRIPGDAAALFVDDPVRPGADPNGPAGIPPLFEPPSNLSASTFNMGSIAAAFVSSHIRLTERIRESGAVGFGFEEEGSALQAGDFPALPSPHLEARGGVPVQGGILPCMIQSFHELVTAAPSS